MDEIVYITQNATKLVAVKQQYSRKTTIFPKSNIIFRKETKYLEDNHKKYQLQKNDIKIIPIIDFLNKKEDNKKSFSEVLKTKENSKEE